MKGMLFQDQILTDRERKNLSILEMIRRENQTTKTDISEKIGVNLVTVSSYVNNFVAKKLVLEKGFDVSEGGRRPVLLELNSTAGYAVGVGISRSKMIGIMTDLKTNVVARVEKEGSFTYDEDSVKKVAAVIREVIEQSQVTNDLIKGIGIAIPGIVNNEKGTIRWFNEDDGRYSLRTLPIKSMIEKEFPVPIMVEDDAVVASFGEGWLGLEPEENNMVYVYNGTRCGIMINGQIYRGSKGGAGGIGVTPPKESSVDYSDGTPGYIKVEAIATKENKGLRLGVKIAYLVNLFDPQVVVVGGDFSEDGSELIDEIKENVKKWGHEEILSNLTIRTSRLGKESMVLGCVGLVIQKAFTSVK